MRLGSPRLRIRYGRQVDAAKAPNMLKVALAGPAGRAGLNRLWPGGRRTGRPSPPGSPAMKARAAHVGAAEGLTQASRRQSLATAVAASSATACWRARGATNQVTLKARLADANVLPLRVAHDRHEDTAVPVGQGVARHVRQRDDGRLQRRFDILEVMARFVEHQLLLIRRVYVKAWHFRSMAMRPRASLAGCEPSTPVNAPPPDRSTRHAIAQPMQVISPGSSHSFHSKLVRSPHPAPDDPSAPKSAPWRRPRPARSARASVGSRCRSSLGGA